MLKKPLPKKYFMLHQILCWLFDTEHKYKNSMCSWSLYNTTYSWGTFDDELKKYSERGYVSFKMNKHGPSSTMVKITYKGIWVKYCLENAYYGHF
jgi:hypothetical protein